MSPMRRKRIRELLLMCLCCCGYLSPQPLRALDTSPLHIGSFNIQVFGQTKISNPTTLQILTRILSRYDLVFIQEIRDSENAAVFQLLQHLQAHSQKNFQVIVSERLGRTVSKEQYAFIYDPTKVRFVESYVYNDTQDLFEREPMVARFHAGQLDFTLVGIHVTPRDVDGELKSLNHVYRDATERFGSRDVFIMGDLNADCAYYNASHGFQYFDDSAAMILPDGIDTTIAQERCSYDRVLGFGGLPKRVQSSGVFRFEEEYGLDPIQTKQVSDHYPVEFVLDVEALGNVPSSQDADPAADGSLQAPTAGGDSSSGPTEKQQPQPSSSGENDPVSAEPARCGQDTAWTPKRYCYGGFDTGRRRVPDACCAELQPPGRMRQAHFL